MVASLAVLSAARVPMVHLWLYYRQLGVPMVASLAVLFATRLLTSSLSSSFLEGIVTTVRVRKVFSLCRQILKDIIMANQEVDAIKGRIS
jgi:hypothetical protein